MTKLALPLLIAVLSLLFSGFQNKKPASKFKACDIIFISNPASQNKSIQLVSKSKFTHIGIVLPGEKGKLQVYFVADKVKKSAIAEFLALSPNGKYDLMRLRDSAAVPIDAPDRMAEEAKKLLGFAQDNYLKWTDMEIYSSEFVWKMFKRTLSFELGELKTLGNYDLSSPVIQKKLKEKFGEANPAGEKAISPDDIRNWPGLVKVN